MSGFVKSPEAIMSLREAFFRLSDAERDRISTILYVIDPSVRRHSPDMNHIGINLEELSESTFSGLREHVNGCLLQMRKELEIHDLARDIIKLPGKSPNLGNLLEWVILTKSFVITDYDREKVFQHLILHGAGRSTSDGFTEVDLELLDRTTIVNFRYVVNNILERHNIEF